MTFVKRALLVALLLAAGCSRPPALSEEKARNMIEASLAFQEPVEDDIRKALSYAGQMKREILRVEAMTLKPDGPWGMAGETATVTFSWRWTAGPLANNPIRTTVKMHGDARGWNVYEDMLKQNLRASLAGDE